MTPTAPAAADIAGLHKRACQSTRTFVAGIQPDQWRNATNSSGDVRGLVNHLVTDQLWTAELLHGKSGADPIPELEGDLLGSDPLGAYDAACAAAQAAWEEPGAAERMCRTSHGDIPAAMYASMRTMDVFIHGWDLASATGQDTTLDPQLVELMYAEWQPRAPMLRASGLFAPEIELPDGAATQTKLLGLLGRREPGRLQAQELGHVSLFVRDLEASVRFYRDLLGFQEAGRVPGTVFLSAGRTHHEFALIQPGPEVVPAPSGPYYGINHIAVKVGDSIEQLRDAKRALVEAGVAIGDVLDYYIQQAIHVQDPDGNEVEVFVDTDKPWRGDPSVFEKGLPKPLYL